ncbi:MAG: hypothetical protein IT383_07575, partial [Deltaproteobacteria bacterium]|nr:hypothetical protein [Deltaproteobacteria bacterium]
MAELWLIIVQVVPVVVVGAATVGVGMRMRTVRRRQQALDEAERALAAAGFDVTPVTEHYVTDPTGASDVEVKTALLVKRGAHLEVAVAAASHDAVHGVMRRRAVAAAKRATFEVRREDALSRARHTLGIHDIEIGDPAFDDALKVSGWPADGARALVAETPVRAALEGAFAFAGVVDVRLVATAETGIVRMSWRLPMESLASLAVIADTVERLAVALDDARFVEPLAKPEGAGASAGSSGPSSGTPMGIPGSGP